MSFTCDGKQMRRSTETKDKKLAEKIHAKILTQIAEGRWFDKPEGETITFREMMERYMKEHSLPNKASSDRDEHSLKYLLPFFGDRKLTEIAPKMVNQYKTERRQAGVSSATVNRELALMRNAYNLAIREWEWVKDNPVSKIRFEKEPPARDRWLTNDEEEKLLKESPEWLRDLIVFAVETGCRQGEILSLTWKNVDLFHKTALIFGSKTGERRTIPLSKRAFELLKEEAQVKMLSNEPVFKNSSGTNISRFTIAPSLRKALNNAGIMDFRFHDLRHTFASRLAQSGIDPYTIQKLLGHKSASMTQRYSHHCVESLRKGIDAFERAREEQKEARLSQFYHNDTKSRGECDGGKIIEFPSH